MHVGGHSQGGGHVALLALDAPVTRVCLLASPIDGAERPTVRGADWTAHPDWATPLEARRAVIHPLDPGFAKARANFEAMGMVEGTHWRRLEIDVPAREAHGAVVKSEDPAAVAARRWACFEGGAAGR